MPMYPKKAVSTRARPPGCEDAWQEDGSTWAGAACPRRVGTVLGVAIGLERQWRSRMAGLHTLALVSMGSALFTIMGAYAFPLRVPTTG